MVNSSHEKETLTHFDGSGAAQMVDVGDKPVTHRTATASATIVMSSLTGELIRSGSVEKGDVLQVARLAGIQGAKQTSSWIPLCHILPLNSVQIRFEWRSPTELKVRATVHAEAKTGVEMEALVAVAAASLTVYDMCKAVDRAMRVDQVQVESKSGGQSGDWQRTE